MSHTVRQEFLLVDKDATMRHPDAGSDTGSDADAGGAAVEGS